MIRHAHIGFLNNEDMLSIVDKDFRDLTKEIYKIPGVGTYGVSCSGYFHDEESEVVSQKGHFLPEPYAHLGIAAMPQLEHVSELIKLIYESIKTDFDARFSIKDRIHSPADFERYSSDKDLEHYSLGTNKDGLYVAVF